MEELLIKIGELVAMEIEEVEQINYLDKETGFGFVIHLKNGEEVILSLI